MTNPKQEFFCQLKSSVSFIFLIWEQIGRVQNSDVGGYSKLQAHLRQHKKPDKLQENINVRIEIQPHNAREASLYLNANRIKQSKI